LRERRVKLGPVVVLDEHRDPGTIAVDGDRVLVGTGGGAVVLGTVQPEGRAAMDASAWVRGLRLTADDRFV
jgi:methionyl-tRNA formyltransferase